jgi:hypothetical protein
MQCVTISLTKNKSGDFSDVNNYRAISVSTAMSKLFETAIFVRVNDGITSVEYKYGFRPNHSNAICILMF